ncbi:tyrosine/serine/threonine protein phosphatase pps1, variant 3 [Basidiobolus ranarum]|uniref:Tyrosine/serine/threonine protein phosphatase pps1, variant 3 n=1 Tax=Basidiobolus ranarum TaxID=34480 RepID=A0ABR2X2E9_9FUNG
MVTTSEVAPKPRNYDLKSNSTFSPIPGQYPLFCNEPPVHKINTEDLVNLYNSYVSQPPPVDILFPWLHSIDLAEYEQAKLFKLSQPDVPHYRGLVLLHSSKEVTKHRLSGSVLFEEIITSSTPPSPEQLSDWTFLAPQNLVTNARTINLRNFASQPARYASISDIIVYSTEGDDSALDIAKKVSMAQLNTARRRKASKGDNGLTYNTYVVTEPFSKIEALLPNLVALDPQGHVKNYTNYWLKEREECQAFTHASEIAPNVWVGNAKDVPCSKPDELYIVPEIFNPVSSNPHDFSICLEASEFTEYPGTSAFKILAAKLAKTPPQENSNLSGPTVYARIGVGISYASESIELVTTKILNVVQFMKNQADQGRRILLYCGDGYSETSIVALTYLMFRHRLTLTQAYFVFQAKRSFSVAHHNLELLMCVEDLVWATLEAENKYQNLKLPLNNNEKNKENQYHNSHEKIFQKDLLAAKEIGSSWFYNSRFKGSFPSRISPHLYLGDLNHATNPDLLKLLGISHILSAGENTKQSTREFEILHLKNLLDDGVDTLMPHIDQCVEFIGTS